MYRITHSLFDTDKNVILQNASPVRARSARSGTTSTSPQQERKRFCIRMLINTIYKDRDQPKLQKAGKYFSSDGTLGE
jgi:hypothetical protein